LRIAGAALVLGLSLVVSRPAPAGTYGAPFEGLQAELETRRDNDFGGVLDATQKKRQKAVLQGLALIAKPSPDAMNDLKVLGSVARLLEKAYPEEMAFGSPSGIWDGSFFAFQLIYGQFVADFGPFSGRVGKMAPSAAQRKAAKFLKAANKATGTVGPDSLVSEAAKAYLKAWKATLKGIPAADAGALLPAPFASVFWNEKQIDTDIVGWIWHSRSRTLDLNVFATDPATGDTHNLNMRFQASPEGTALQPTQGSYALAISGAGEEIYDYTDGIVSVTTLDIPGHRFEGTLDLIFFTGLGDILVSGTVSASWYLEVVED
jgi:hypothetical protein